jgi:hypothetical protein
MTETWNQQASQLKSLGLKLAIFVVKILKEKSE